MHHQAGWRAPEGAAPQGAASDVVRQGDADRCRWQWTRAPAMGPRRGKTCFMASCSWESNYFVARNEISKVAACLLDEDADVCVVLDSDSVLLPLWIFLVRVENHWSCWGASWHGVGVEGRSQALPPLRGCAPHRDWSWLWPPPSKAGPTYGKGLAGGSDGITGPRASLWRTGRGLPICARCKMRAASSAGERRCCSSRRRRPRSSAVPCRPVRPVVALPRAC